MPLSIACTDKPDALPVRRAARPDHVLASVTITAFHPVFGGWTTNDG